MSILNRWAFDGYPLNRPGVRVRAMTGVLGLPPLRGADFLTPGVPGQLFVPKVPDSRRIGLEILVNEGEEAAVSDYLDTLATLFGQRGQSPLAHFHPDGTMRTALAECCDWAPQDGSQIGSLYVGVADFLLADPFFYGPSVADTAPISATPTTLTVTNRGTSQGPGPQGQLVLDYLGTGTIINPRFTNTTTGAWVEVDVTVAAGKHLIVDCVAITALNDGVNVIGNVTHSGQLQLMSLAPGANVISVTAVPTPSGTLTVKHKDVYL